MSEKYFRNIYDENFWVDFYINNSIKLNNLTVLVQKGNKFIDRLFNSENNQDLLIMNYDIKDKENETISFISYNILKRNVIEDIPDTNSLNKILKFEERLLKNINLIKITLLCVYASDEESTRLDVEFGDPILLIKTKFYQNSELILYKEEFTNLETFIFEDKYNEGISL